MELVIQFESGPLDGQIRIFKPENGVPFELKSIAVPYIKPISEYTDADFYRMRPDFQYITYKPTNRSVDGAWIWAMEEGCMNDKHTPIEPYPFHPLPSALTEAPANKWEAFKQKWFPAWALKRWPVKTCNIYKEINQLMDDVSGVMGVPKRFIDDDPA